MNRKLMGIGTIGIGAIVVLCLAVTVAFLIGKGSTNNAAGNKIQGSTAGTS